MTAWLYQFLFLFLFFYFLGGRNGIVWTDFRIREQTSLGGEGAKEQQWVERWMASGWQVAAEAAGKFGYLTASCNMNQDIVRLKCGGSKAAANGSLSGQA